MARTIKGNELAIQSYIFTTAKYDFNAYEKRIMYRLVEFCGTCEPSPTSPKP